MLVRAVRRLRREWMLARDPVGYARSIGVRVGNGSVLLGTGPSTWGTEPYLIELGERVMVTAGVRFLTHDGAVWVFRADEPDIDRFGPVRVGDDVFIGTDAMVLPGVTIGARSVVGSGSVVTRDVPAGVVVAGVPAREICTVDDYRSRHADEFTYIHRRSEPEKRRALMTRFGISEQ